jgi:hypothetical protein
MNMYNANRPELSDLPSSAKLMQSTAIAAVAALVILITVIMPAEYGIDPSGLGELTGLKRMGEIKVSLAREAEEEAVVLTDGTATLAVPTPQAAVNPPTGTRSDEMQVSLAPDQGTEIKVITAKGATIGYSWESSGGQVAFDVHGDSKALNINYYSYSKGAAQSEEGSFVAEFDGNHGWYWRNRTPETVIITLKTSGTYTDIKHLE